MRITQLSCLQTKVKPQEQKWDVRSITQLICMQTDEWLNGTARLYGKHLCLLMALSVICTCWLPSLSAVSLSLCVILCVKGLLDLADSYCEKHLKRRCERLLWQSVSVENVTSLISIASKYKAEVGLRYRRREDEIEGSGGKGGNGGIEWEYREREKDSHRCYVCSAVSLRVQLQVCSETHDTGSAVRDICPAGWLVGQGVYPAGSQAWCLQDVTWHQVVVVQYLCSICSSVVVLYSLVTIQYCVCCYFCVSCVKVLCISVYLSCRMCVSCVSIVICIQIFKSA